MFRYLVIYISGQQLQTKPLIGNAIRQRRIALIGSITDKSSNKNEHIHRLSVILHLIDQTMYFKVERI